MKLARDLNGEELIRTLRREWGYGRTGQVGSHVVLETDTPSHQRLVVPAHKSLRVGTCFFFPWITSRIQRVEVVRQTPEAVN